MNMYLYIWVSMCEGNTGHLSWAYREITIVLTKLEHYSLSNKRSLHCSALTHNESIILGKSLSASLPLTWQTTNWFSLGGEWQLIKQCNVVVYEGVLTNIACAWKCLKAFLVLFWKNNGRLFSPGKKGIILFLGSFCPPSIGNLSRILICKNEGES